MKRRSMKRRSIEWSHDSRESTRSTCTSARVSAGRRRVVVGTRYRAGVWPVRVVGDRVIDRGAAAVYRSIGQCAPANGDSSDDHALACDSDGDLTAYAGPVADPPRVVYWRRGG